MIKRSKKYAPAFISDLRAKKTERSLLNKRYKPEIYRYFQKKWQDKTNKELKKLRLAKLTNNNILESDMVNIRQLAAIPAKTLRQIARLRNISQNLSKSNIIYALVRSEPVVNEQKYIIDNNNKIYNRISKIRLQLFDISPYINKKERGDIRKRLWGIGKIKKNDRKLHNKLMKELNSISVE